MLRLHLLLLLAVVICALATVAANNRTRKTFADLEREQSRMRDLEIEWGQLQLEQSTWANSARVEKFARQTLRMKAPEAAQTLVVEVPPAQERK